ncbi:MAG: hypothetical protein ACJAVI_003101 [Candidatus Azotimanducaceae bacterium]|jgi:hypothetical protein
MNNPTTVLGPIQGGNFGWPFAASMLDLAALGYRETEYFLQGNANCYRMIDGAEQDQSGFWAAEKNGNAAYKTRFIVYHPENPADFNGTVVLTWNNVTAGHDLFQADSKELFENGYALVFLTPQKVGIDGLAPIHQGLHGWDPVRYPDLNIPSDDYSFDIFSQAAEAIGPNRAGLLDPMDGLDVKRVIAQGASQSAGRLATFINAIAPIHNPIDGFILQIYFGRGTPLEVGETVVNINTPQTGNPAERLQGTNLLRDDLGVPIFVVNSELEATACYGVRQPDTDSMRFWEVAGTSHTSIQGRAVRQKLLDRDKLISSKVDPRINAIPISPVYDAVFHHMQQWLTDGTIPPIVAKIEFEGKPPQPKRDHLGIAIGGIRLPQADTPLATNSAIPLSDDIFSLLGGSSVPFTREKVISLHGNKDSYLSSFKIAADLALTNGTILPRALKQLLQEASETWDKLK